MKSFIYSIIIGILSFVILSVAIFNTKIYSNDFSATKSVSGTYKYLPGGSRGNASSIIVTSAGEDFYAACLVNFFGSENSCANKKMNGKFVQAEYGEYPTFYGRNKVLMLLKSDDGTSIATSREKMILYWRQKSYAVAAYISTIISMLSMAILYTIYFPN